MLFNPALSKAELLQRYQADDINIALHGALLAGNAAHVRTIFQLEPNLNLLQRDGKTKKNAIDIAVDAKQLDLLKVMAQSKQDQLTHNMMIICLKTYITAHKANEVGTEHLIKCRHLIIDIYQMSSLTQNKFAMTTYHTAAFQLAEYYIQKEDSEALFPLAIILAQLKHTLDLAKLKALFVKHQAKPDVAVAYGIFLLRHDASIAAWIFDSFLWRRLSVEKFRQFADLQYPAKYNQSHAGSIQLNRSLAYKMMFYMTLDKAYAGVCLDIYRDIGHPGLAGLEALISTVAQISRGQHEVAQQCELTAFFDYFAETAQHLQPMASKSFDRDLDREVRQAIRGNRDVLDLLDMVAAGQYQLSPAQIIAVFHYVNVSCRKKLFYREKIVGKMPILDALVKEYYKHLSAFTNQEQVDCFYEVAKLPLAKPSYLPTLLACANKLFVRVLACYDLPQRCKLLGAIINLKLSADEFKKSWRLVKSILSRLDSDHHIKSLSDHIDIAYSSAMLALVFAHSHIPIPGSLVHVLNKSIEHINKKREKAPPRALYKVHFIADFMSRGYPRSTNINSELCRKAAEYIHTIRCTTTTSPLQDNFEEFLQHAGVNYEAEAMISGLPVDFFLPDYNIIVQIDGRRHFKFTDEDREYISLDIWHDFQVGGISIISVGYDGNNDSFRSFSKSPNQVVRIDYQKMNAMRDKDYDTQRQYWQSILGEQVKLAETQIEKKPHRF